MWFASFAFWVHTPQLNSFCQAVQVVLAGETIKRRALNEAREPYLERVMDEVSDAMFQEALEELKAKEN